MKLRYAILILLAACLINVAGFCFKISHWPGADELMTASLVASVVAAVCLVYALVTHKKIRAFLRDK